MRKAVCANSAEPVVTRSQSETFADLFIEEKPFEWVREHSEGLMESHLDHIFRLLAVGVACN